MALDMSKMRAKLDALEKKNGGDDGVFFKLEEGETVLRVVPVPDGDPFKERFFHYGLGRSILCPHRNFNEKCPVCDFVRTLYDDGTEESRKMAGDIRAKQRFYSPVVVRGKEEEGSRVWGYGKTVYKQLIELVLDPDYGDITNEDGGHDLKVKYKLPTKKGEYPETSVTARPKPSKLSDTSDVSTTILESVPNFNDIFEKKTYAEVKAALDAYILGDEPEAVASTTEKFGADKPEANSVDAAFAELAS